MAVCRLNWPFSYSFQFVVKSTGAAVVAPGVAIEARIFSKPGGATLKTWTSAQGFVTSQAGSRIVFNVPAAEMATPLVAGSLAIEIRRTDVTPNQILLMGFLRVREATSS